MESNDEKAKRREDFLKKKELRRQAEAKTTIQIIEEAKKLFSSDASKDFFRKLAENKL
ncbi:MAG TPA: hypothetical protein VIL78_20835 [Hanamia sp.]|jgi:lipid-binding SYLF domain-containing protein